jgi:hypothetical protein
LLQLGLDLNCRKKRCLGADQVPLQQVRTALQQEQGSVLAILRLGEADNAARVGVTPGIDQILHESVRVF